MRRHDCNIEDGKTLLLFHNDQVYQVLRIYWTHWIIEFQSSSGDFQFECPDYTWSVSENWVPAYQLFYLMAVCVQDCKYLEILKSTWYWPLSVKENLESPAPTTCQCEHFWSDTASIEGWSVLNLYFYSEVSENQCSWRVSCVELKYNVNSTAQLEIDGEFYVVYLWPKRFSITLYIFRRMNSNWNVILVQTHGRVLLILMEVPAMLIKLDLPVLIRNNSNFLLHSFTYKTFFIMQELHLKTMLCNL